ncbi:1-phosphofructokinase [Alkaliphilus metalliredigens QYMF]|uniref:Tagatose-6-phosphate kinase n=1 Tax=Alkaliphilus metalliredigens (strain QYMF) TaxID=293826 RepID=A6TVX8_ALKMQ|nr:1-phosphofructokinase [Alkaliphilus metalliredigens]ABR50346.1 1-phosphofructokinase [Alkaliphilus metalliredigens QYMF]
MIVTLTLNPAVDKTIEIDSFQINHVNRVSSARLDAGGKGINVSKGVHTLGEKSKAMGILAGKSGQFIKEQLDILKIDNDFLFVGGETRTNIKVVDRINHSNTDINEKGPDIAEPDLAEVICKTLEAVHDGDILVLSGSVPSNIDSNIYGVLIARAKEKGVKTILDADGALLKQGIKAGPYLVKPNIYELERLYNTQITSKEKAIEVAMDIFAYGVELIVISLGEEGSILMTKEETVIVEGIEVDVISTVGAGDSMVAALAVAIHRDYPLEKAIRLATATSAASVMTSGTETGEMNVIEQLEKKVKLISYDNREVVK